MTLARRGTLRPGGRFMRRNCLRIWLAACGWAICGCAGAWRSEPPVDLSARLERIERERLRSDAAARPEALVAPGGMTRPDRLSAGGSTGKPMALVDMAPEGGGTASGSETAIDKEAVYARRPPLPGFGETVKRDAGHVGSDLWRDTKRVYANPVNLAILGVAYGGALAVQESGPDDTVEDHYNRHHTFNGDWPDTFGAMGNPGVHFALAGMMYLVGQQARNDKTYEVGKTLFSALIINDLSVMLGQAASWDRSPNGEWGTFPSGHTSSTFCVATVLNESYGPLVGVPMYGLGVLVGIERLDDREHYLSDVLFGAVMGTVIGHSVASGRDPEIFGWKVLPYADPAGGSSGVAFMKSFK